MPIDDVATALADGLDAAVVPWVEGCVARVVRAWTGNETVPDPVAAAATAAGRQARDDVMPRLRSLLAADVDHQATTPLALVREAVRYPTAVLRAAGVPEVARDEFSRRAFPDDWYDLSPATLADVDPSLAEPGLRWGAAKAFEHRRRHRS
jgi:hypothetical protein